MKLITRAKVAREVIRDGLGWFGMVRDPFGGSYKTVGFVVLLLRDSFGFQ